MRPWTRPTRRSAKTSVARRAAILVAAETLFLQNGVAHTSLEQIARQAGVTRGAVYWHFENKAHLFHEMLSQVRLPPEQMAERLSGCADRDPLLALRELCVEEATARFDLARGALIRGRLIRLGPEEHVFLLTLHHIASDGWSIGVLVRELGALYGAIAQSNSAVGGRVVPSASPAA